MKMPWDDLARKAEADYNADLLLFFGPISGKWDDFLIDTCKARAKKKNVLLMLTTLGGDAHAAYRMARCLQQNYRPAKIKPTGQDSGQVIIFVPSICASAGTLMTLAADKLIMTEHSQLGPLDVQLRKPDEVGERTSGLTPIQAINFLEKEAIKFFKAQFSGLRFARDMSFSTKMAADIAAQPSTGVLSRLYDQIDPLRLAEYYRISRIAEHYGERIRTGNVKENTIKHLLEEYPSHEYCIDAEEAKELFKTVEKPSKELEDIWEFFKPYAEQCLLKDDNGVFFLTDPGEKPDKDGEGNKAKKKTGDEQNRTNDAGAKQSASGNGGETKPEAGPGPVADRPASQPEAGG